MEYFLGKKAVDMSVPTARIQLLVLPYVAGSFLFAIPFLTLWGWREFAYAWQGMFANWWVLPAILLGVLLHELIHAITWKQLAGLGWKEMKLGLQWRTLTPYAHAKKPMQITPYRWGALMPALLLGFLPYGISLFTGNGWLFAYGMLFIVAAAGDFWILAVLRKVPKGSWVADHPENAGCIVYQAQD
ncbi:hypothetical protein OKW21_005675 [Catalinimonas alkaloidigena]|uniref:DUF3267 domain-containing protein n=1 Tax=Catalinimonas alkaloidigena TaxID=1075417 RepID=UPI002406AE24|nr:DUF3267 domain-containing protein [Catalinimonas alkaloidigena]MDF9800412.1 hypothetical protein [Catalinimonas alkaloidigena]